MDYDDPDYQCYNSNLKLKKENDITNKIDALRKKFDESFQNELKLRETQLETIENRLAKARKTLHLLRYVLVSSYYKSQEFEVNKEDDITDKQNRIHPAVKRLLGDNLESIQSVGQRRKRFKIEPTNLSEKVISDETENKTNLNINENENVNLNLVKNELDTVDIIRNRKQVKKRIIVGNISKFMPAENKNDSTTHKWMMYVRSQKDCEDISTFVEKVMFYLHPSYKPNDVIELTQAPFHLSRRGWGEFPLRVRIFFKCELNKPVDIIHNLKLDKTYSGRQTLGNETIVDLSLFENNSLLNEDDEINLPTTSKVQVQLQEFDQQELSPNKEIIFLEHSYTIKKETSTSTSQENMDVDLSIIKTEGERKEEETSPDNNEFTSQEISNDIHVQDCAYVPELLESDSIIKREEIFTDIFQTDIGNIDIFSE